jgi:predicted negative regulator of RcsB-dependent stress response
LETAEPDDGTLLGVRPYEFPDSSNAHDSLGEALALQGDTSGAVRSYRRALELATEERDKDRIREMLTSLERG